MTGSKKGGPPEDEYGRLQSEETSQMGPPGPRPTLSPQDLPATGVRAQLLRGGGAQKPAHVGKCGFVTFPILMCTTFHCPLHLDAGGGMHRPALGPAQIMQLNQPHRKGGFEAHSRTPNPCGPRTQPQQQQPQQQQQQWPVAPYRDLSPCAPTFKPNLFAQHSCMAGSPQGKRGSIGSGDSGIKPSPHSPLQRHQQQQQQQQQQPPLARPPRPLPTQQQNPEVIVLLSSDEDEDERGEGHSPGQGQGMALPPVGKCAEPAMQGRASPPGQGTAPVGQVNGLPSRQGHAPAMLDSTMPSGQGTALLGQVNRLPLCPGDAPTAQGSDAAAAAAISTAAPAVGSGKRDVCDRLVAAAGACEGRDAFDRLNTAAGACEGQQLLGKRACQGPPSPSASLTSAPKLSVPHAATLQTPASAVFPIHACASENVSGARPSSCPTQPDTGVGAPHGMHAEGEGRGPARNRMQVEGEASGAAPIGCHLPPNPSHTSPIPPKCAHRAAPVPLYASPQQLQSQHLQLRPVPPSPLPEIRPMNLQLHRARSAVEGVENGPALQQKDPESMKGVEDVKGAMEGEEGLMQQQQRESVQKGSEVEALEGVQGLQGRRYQSSSLTARLEGVQRDPAKQEEALVQQGGTGEGEQAVRAPRMLRQCIAVGNGCDVEGRRCQGGFQQLVLQPQQQEQGSEQQQHHHHHHYNGVEHQLLQEEGALPVCPEGDQTPQQQQQHHHHHHHHHHHGLEHQLLLEGGPLAACPGGDQAPQQQQQPPREPPRPEGDCNGQEGACRRALHELPHLCDQVVAGDAAGSGYKDYKDYKDYKAATGAGEASAAGDAAGRNAATGAGYAAGAGNAAAAGAAAAAGDTAVGAAAGREKAAAGDAAGAGHASAAGDAAGRNAAAAGDIAGAGDAAAAVAARAAGNAAAGGAAAAGDTIGAGAAAGAGDAAVAGDAAAGAPDPSRAVEDDDTSGEVLDSDSIDNGVGEALGDAGMQSDEGKVQGQERQQQRRQRGVAQGQPSPCEDGRAQQQQQQQQQLLEIWQEDGQTQQQQQQQQQQHSHESWQAQQRLVREEQRQKYLLDKAKQEEEEEARTQAAAPTETLQAAKPAEAPEKREAEGGWAGGRRKRQRMEKGREQQDWSPPPLQQQQQRQEPLQVLSDADIFKGLRFMYPPGDTARAMEVSAIELGRLEEDAWLNDTVMDFYLRVIEQSLPPASRGRYYFFNSFFYKKLTEEQPTPPESPAPSNNASPKGAVKGTPSQEAGVTPCILHLDSLEGSRHDPNTVCSTLRSYLHHEWVHKAKTVKGSVPYLWQQQEQQPCAQGSQPYLPFTSAKDCPHRRVNTLPRQNNCNDCGLFVLAYAEFFCHGDPNQVTIKQLPAETQRKKSTMEAHFNSHSSLVPLQPDFLTSNWFTIENVTALRLHLKYLVFKHMLEQSPGAPAHQRAELQERIDEYEGRMATGRPGTCYLPPSEYIQWTQAARDMQQSEDAKKAQEQQDAEMARMLAGPDLQAAPPSPLATGRTKRNSAGINSSRGYSSSIFGIEDSEDGEGSGDAQQATSAGSSDAEEHIARLDRKRGGSRAGRGQGGQRGKPPSTATKNGAVGRQSTLPLVPNKKQQPLPGVRGGIGNASLFGDGEQLEVGSSDGEREQKEASIQLHLHRLSYNGIKSTAAGYTGAVQNVQRNMQLLPPPSARASRTARTCNNRSPQQLALAEIERKQKEQQLKQQQQQQQQQQQEEQQQAQQLQSCLPGRRQQERHRPPATLPAAPHAQPVCPPPTLSPSLSSSPPSAPPLAHTCIDLTADDDAAHSPEPPPQPTHPTCTSTAPAAPASLDQGFSSTEHAPVSQDQGTLTTAHLDGHPNKAPLQGPSTTAPDGKAQWNMPDGRDGNMSRSDVPRKRGSRLQYLQQQQQQQPQLQLQISPASARAPQPAQRGDPRVPAPSFPKHAHNDGCEQQHQQQQHQQQQQQQQQQQEQEQHQLQQGQQQQQQQQQRHDNVCSIGEGSQGSPQGQTYPQGKHSWESGLQSGPVGGEEGAEEAEEGVVPVARGKRRRESQLQAGPGDGERAEKDEECVFSAARGKGSRESQLQAGPWSVERTGKDEEGVVCVAKKMHVGVSGTPLMDAGAAGSPLMHPGAAGTPLMHPGAAGTPLRSSGGGSSAPQSGASCEVDTQEMQDMLSLV
ncbi:hypothetical protein DUNSADRAFT_1089 [Dunaliella salina]|uniref:Ubiquitin-like protease family profile domain-containing protein n=2 Tax=Dunaliella salina TaxID=3046 RepID=A0ABQ7GXH4_DUNSA|nr:hypothetical protein DUNSADRAFT_1089 [Dunaliella salina]|eukprot:KAF5839313.1 hypothetical protein DUNSADRAFT_1089 [Dunaliella salina]